jgi:acyl carrier protein
MTAGAEGKKSMLGGFLKFLPSKRAADTDDGQPKDREAIQAWLIKKVSAALSISSDDIDPRETFASFGLDSRTAVSLSGDLERWLGRRLPPTLVWDYPSIDELAQHLALDQSSSLTDVDSRAPAASR